MGTDNPASPRRRAVRFAQAALLGALGLAGCADNASTDQCGKLLDRIIDQEVAATGGKELPEKMKADLAKQKAALTEQARGDFMKACTKKTPKAVVECGLTAKSMDDFATCDRQ
jgi:hypothetical protein